MNEEQRKTPVEAEVNQKNVVSNDNTFDAEDKIKEVNRLLKDGEPENISVDTYSNQTGYKPQYIIDCMNAGMGIGNWGFEEVSNELVDKDEKTSKPLLAIAQVKVWVKGVAFQPVAYGQSRVTRGDFGDAKKGAQTDAIKKAFSYFSIGNRAYHGKLEA